MAGPQNKILLVTDDPVIPRLLTSIFRNLAIVTAKDNAEAFRAVQENPDLRLLIADPELTGPALLSQFQTTLPHVAQIHLSRSGPTAATDSVHTSVPARTLLRPFREHELFESVEQALRIAPHNLATGAVDPQTQRLEKRAEELEELNRRKDELVLIAAHDIRAPISVILGYADILLSTEEGMSESGRAILERIQGSAHRMLTLVNNILNLAALEEGKLELKQAPHKLSDLVREVLENLSGMIEEKQIQCSVDVQGDDQLYELDGVKVQQVLQNLISNAAKFNRKQGTIHVGVQATPRLIQFQVRDTGMGMTPDQVERAFSRFSRFSSQSDPGSGLGLAIARGIVRLHGGRIWLETERDKGTTFLFTIEPGHRPEKSLPVLA